DEFCKLIVCVLWTFLLLLYLVDDDKSKGLFLKNIRSCRLRAFAFAGLESFCCSTPSLDLIVCVLWTFLLLLYLVDDDKSKGLFLKNIRSCRLRAFAFAGLESFCCSTPSLDLIVCVLWTFLLLLYLVDDDKSKGLFLKNIRSCRLRAFAFAGLESFCCSTPSLDV
ncbi:hypothetical protein Tsubulata_013575, partial [Turnera subulata]